MPPPTVDLTLFAGQGTSGLSTARTQALEDARSASGATLLSACHGIFHAELSSLSPEHLGSLCRVNLQDFETPESIIEVPPVQYRNRPIFSWASFLTQALRYLAHVEGKGIADASLTPFSDVLKQSDGVLGFSAGIVIACVVASSSDLASYISNAAQAYRLVLWIGIRMQIYRATVMDSADAAIHDDSPWGIVIMGISKDEAESRIQAFDSKPLYITTVLDSTCVTVSGRPDTVAKFALTLPSRYDVHQTTLDTLYHCPSHANDVRQQIIKDIARRGIKFPDFQDLKAAIRSTYTGEVLSGPASLVELVVDMIVIQPGNWNVVVQKLVQAAQDEAIINVLNFGPGRAPLKALDRAFAGRVSSRDAQRGGHVVAKQEPIAIVGMSVNLPSAPNTDKLWEVLENGINTISEVPEHRFKISDFDGANPKRHLKAQTGNFLDNVDEFDNVFFKISPREAKNMDPQQRLLLHTAYEALEDSGYVPNATPSFNPDRFGCYIGVASGDYVLNLREEIDVYYTPSTVRGFHSGRVSFAMQLSGPSVVVDTTCSSSNVAIYQGVRALMTGDCDAVLVGGVNAITSPDASIGLDRGHFLSPTGQCKSFDASGDGYSRGEGCVIFVLKRLRDAVAHNDRILGIIRGVEVNQSGLAHSITHPHADTQAALFRQVLANAGIDPHRVNVVEAHAAGTQAGDTKEVASLRRVLAINRAKDNPLHLTSLKANIGHLEAASGAAGLAKLLLMFQHKRIPRQISLTNLNPLISPLEQDNLVINKTDTEWAPSHAGMPRLALLNNFGASGSNTALLVEEHLKPSLTGSISDGMTFIFGLSAKTRPALDELRARYLDWLHNPASADVPLSDIAYTMTARRQIYEFRICVAASTRAELVEKLGSVHITQTPSSHDSARVAFVFSGQGSQYVGMGRRLYYESALFRRCVDECEMILVGAGFPGARAIILGTDGSGMDPAQEMEAYQSAIFVLEYGLAQLWISWGVVPAAVVGHSLGEYAALATTGVLAVKDALLIVANRVRLMVQQCASDSSGMLAVNLSPAAIESALKRSNDFGDLTIGCYNSPVDCVLSGPLSHLQAFKAHLDSEIGCKSVLLSVPFGYHSAAMAPILDDLIAVSKRFILRPPTIPIVSNLLGSIVLAGDSSVFTPAYFARHCAEPVQFDRGVRALLSLTQFSEIDTWFEMGPHTTCLPMLRANPALTGDVLLLGSLKKQEDPFVTLMASLARLYTSGLSLQWRATFAHLAHVSCISLPSYPFAKTKFWVPFREIVETPTAKLAGDSFIITEYAMLHRWGHYPSVDNNFVAVFETPIQKLAALIVGHRVGDIPFCPASAYLEIAFEGVKLTAKHLETSRNDSNIVLRRVEFERPLLYEENVGRIVVTKIALVEDKGTFTINSRLDSSRAETVHVRGEFECKKTSLTITKFAERLSVVTRHAAAVTKAQDGSPPEVFSTRTAYEVIFTHVVDYGKPYQAMRSVTVAAGGMEGCAVVQLPKDYDRGKFVVHPIWVDAIFHVAGFVVNLQGGTDVGYICTHMGTVNVLPELIDTDQPYLVYCSIASLPEEGVMVAEAYAVQSVEPRRIVAHGKGMKLRRVRLSTFRKSLAYTMKPVQQPPQAIKSILIATKPGSHSSSTSTPVDVVIKLVADACDVAVSAVQMHTDLASIGIDSMMSIEIFGGLRMAFPGADLAAHDLSACVTVADICREVTSKVNGSAHAAPSSGLIGPESTSPFVPVESPSASARSVDALVMKLVADTCDVPPSAVQLHTDLASIGIDSMMSIEIFGALRIKFPDAELAAHDLSSCITVADISRKVASKVELSMPSSPSLIQTESESTSSQWMLEDDLYSEEAAVCELEEGSRQTDTSVSASLARITKALQLDTLPVLIQRPETHRGRLPLFLIHDGSGLINYYHRLSSLDRPIWAIHNPRFASGRPWAGLADMAATYVDYILSETSGPLLLGGWSFGGVAAHEIALQLARRGIEVKGILLIDPPSPIEHVPLSGPILDTVLDVGVRVTSSELTALVKKQFYLNTRLLGDYVAPETTNLCPPLVLLRSSEGFRPPGVVHIPTWLSDRSNPETTVSPWQSLAHREIKCVDIPGHHFDVFHPSNIAEVSLRIAEACQYLESL
ncbi:putative polyketide synthase [Mycena vitilis]|nr:putative polyketide synthase [Mycena vitilis]